ncbi:MAG: 16S rRNA (adenine(1518)-N(6)/adenine(1519)-N(6))-dimethyltransferase RsmA [Acidobacteriota bacterium]
MRPKRHLGQNFLTGSHFPTRIVDFVRPAPDEPILEIGPGEGALTGLLLNAGARVTAIEVDADLLPQLQLKFGANPAFSLIEADALRVDLCRLFAEGVRVRVVANLPYYISTPLIQRLIEQRQCISEMTLMLQREVVERIIAQPGGKEYGYLSVLVQLYAEVAKLFDVPPGAFRPAPKVTSSVIRLRLRRTTVVPVNDERRFLVLAQVLFAQRRKTILNNLRAGYGRLGIESVERLPAMLEMAQLDGRRRAETLSLTELARLANLLGLPESGAGT